MPKPAKETAYHRIQTSPEGLPFIWSGPAPTGKYIGQDTVGAYLMREKYPKQPIYFWCNKAIEPHYKAYFQDSVTVINYENFAKRHKT